MALRQKTAARRSSGRGGAATTAGPSSRRKRGPSGLSGRTIAPKSLAKSSGAGGRRGRMSGIQRR